MTGADAKDTLEQTQTLTGGGGRGFRLRGNKTKHIGEKTTPEFEISTVRRAI